MNPKILILGLDGATWEVLMPLINRNRLPTFLKIINQGVHGDFLSTFPPSTGPAWLSMATGKNPGKTGVYDFLTKKGNELSTQVLSSYDFKKNNTYWDILNNNGFKTYLLNHPLLYPLYKINGVMVGGMGTPIKAGIVYPESLEKKLNEVSGGYITSVDWNLSKYNDKKKLVQDLHTFIDKQFKVIKYLIKEDWDLFLHVSSASDFLQHVMWEDWNDNTSKYHNDFISIWEKFDQKIKMILEEINDTNVFIVSDHGFGNLSENFNVSKWLLEKNFLKINPNYKSLDSLNNLLNFIYNKIENSPLKKILFNEKFKFSFITKTLNIGYPFPPEVDIIKSKVVPGFSSAAYGALHIMESVKDYNNFREEIIRELKKLEKTYRFKLDIFKREELYNGEASKQAPDILFKINDHQCNIQSSTLKGEIYTESIPFDNKSGSHRSKGIFCAFGPDIKEGLKINAKIYDLAPTILHIFDIPIPNDIDGKVLNEIFKKDSEYLKRKPKYSKLGSFKKPEDEKLKSVIKDLKLKKKI
jgi:predicted AlkP superfamily phosphohydrolase/phosphomutase